MSVTTVLWDADGVLQQLPAGWEASMRPVVGHLVDDVDGFLAEAFEAERPALAGRARWVEVLPVLLERWGLADRYDDALQVWLTIEPVVETQDVVRALRGHGLRCCLATNQDEHRGRHMQETFGYADLFDATFYSYELGVAKPDPGYFTAVLDRLHEPAHRVLFVDDNRANVEAARTVGLLAEQWHVDDGQPALRAHLARHGLPV
ncbi:HAD-IA family hydrolase [Nocardioides panacis]|uniref:HAD-IA family hydrolase n=1 Tax=Nocardioides panacis TaxID=2849501 RepID=A0A975SYP5_9ACTN|nr:HAD-IA family hydrolase [Nocardioides panacis]QWZ08387.1 HAD-IA family hydrolase [Nocardioides panacis]